MGASANHGAPFGAAEHLEFCGAGDVLGVCTNGFFCRNRWEETRREEKKCKKRVALGDVIAYKQHVPPSGQRSCVCVTVCVCVCVCVCSVA